MLLHCQRAEPGKWPLEVGGDALGAAGLPASGHCACHKAQRSRPYWRAHNILGTPPAVVGLIEGLVAMGYRENEDFVIGVRFTQGDSSVLPAVARELVRDGVDILFCIGESEAKAAQQTTTTHPLAAWATRLGKGSSIRMSGRAAISPG